MTLAERQKQLAEKREELHEIYQKSMLKDQKDPDTGAQLFDPAIMTKSMIEECQKREKELGALEDDYQRARLADAAERNRVAIEQGKEIDRKKIGAAPYIITNADGSLSFADKPQKKLSEMFVETRAYDIERKNNPRKYGQWIDGVDVKTLMTLSAGYAPANPRTDKVVFSAQRRPVVSDLIPTDPTDLQVIKYMEETTFTNNASSVAEGGQKPEVALAFTERSNTVQKIAAFLPVTEEQLDDVPSIRNIIDNRLTLMLLLEEEYQLLYGSGGGSDQTGFFQKAGIQSQAFNTNNADTFFMGMTKVRWTGFAEPSAGIMNPNNWQTIRLMKTSGSGEYIMGNPMQEVDTRLFGKPIVVTSAISPNQGLVGDFVMYSHISRKMGVRLDVADQHSDWFQYNKLAIRIEMREALEIYRAAAFCQLTSLI